VAPRQDDSGLGFMIAPAVNHWKAVAGTTGLSAMFLFSVAGCATYQPVDTNFQFARDCISENLAVARDGQRVMGSGLEISVFRTS
jgi:hypothetical protein